MISVLPFVLKGKWRSECEEFEKEFSKGLFRIRSPLPLLGTITYCISANSFESYPPLYNSYVAMADFSPDTPME